MIKKLNRNFKEQWSLWKCRWNNEPENCRKSFKAWLWLIPLLLTFNIGIKIK